MSQGRIAALRITIARHEADISEANAWIENTLKAMEHWEELRNGSRKQLNKTRIELNELLQKEKVQ